MSTAPHGSKDIQKILSEYKKYTSGKVYNSKKLEKNIATAYITARKYLEYIDRRVRGEKK